MTDLEKKISIYRCLHVKTLNFPFCLRFAVGARYIYASSNKDQEEKETAASVQTKFCRQKNGYSCKFPPKQGIFFRQKNGYLLLVCRKSIFRIKNLEQIFNFNFF